MLVNLANFRRQDHQRIRRTDNIRNVAKIEVISPGNLLKSSTAKGLAALIHQKYIVTDLFGDSLYSALTAIEDILDPDSMPDPAEYLPITDDYPADFFKPNPGRIELFKGVTFIFLDEGQYNNLVTPISAGLGKAVIYNANGKTVDDLVKFASDKGQTLLVQRNVGDQDTFCVEASHRYLISGRDLTKTRSSSHHTKQSLGPNNASGSDSPVKTNRTFQPAGIY